jgi:hypothetical protein
MTPARNQTGPEVLDGYEFGRLPRTAAHFPFSTREFARLLVLRGRVRDGLFGAHDLAALDEDTDLDISGASVPRD